MEIRRLLIGLCVETGLCAQVTYDAVGGGVCGTNETACATGNTTLTWSHTTGSGTNRGMVVACTVTGQSSTVEPAISTITYNTVGLSQLLTIPGNYYLSLWTLPNGTQPASGAHNVVVTMASALVFSTNAAIDCASVTAAGVDQTSAWSVANATGSGVSGTTASATLGASGANDLIIAAVSDGTAVGAAGTGITSRRTHNQACCAAASIGIGTGAGGRTALSWTVTNDRWEMVGAAFRVAGGGGGGSASPRLHPIFGMWFEQMFQWPIFRSR